MCFQTFSVWIENDLDRKYRFLMGPAEIASSPIISQIEQNLWFYLQTLGAGSYIPSFSGFFNNFLKNIFLNVTFFSFVLYFLLKRDRKRNNHECYFLGNSIPQKIICFSLIQFFRGGNILTWQYYYNNNNNIPWLSPYTKEG